MHDEAQAASPPVGGSVTVNGQFIDCVRAWLEVPRSEVPEAVANARPDEQPTLRKKFGAEYEEYCRNVRRWLPRVRGDVMTKRHLG